MRALPPLSLYVHLPWCVRKCPYCDFNSHPMPATGIAQAAYVAALLDDLDFAARGNEGRELTSVFFGGGTPSLFDASAIGSVLDRARRHFRIAAGLEVTLEANPGTVEHGRFAAYRAVGVNRVSLGAQSFDDARLAAIGRIHAREETLAAVQELRAAGIDNFNLDLMYALPGQSVAGALRDVETALDLAPAHISHYQLTLEPGTEFAKRPPALPDDDAACEMQVACQELLAGAGYGQYEVSAYASEAGQCRHNLNYWRFGDYLGIGAGAHSKVTAAGGFEVTRTERVRHPGRYMAAPGPESRVACTRTLQAGDLSFEFCLNALRLDEGFDATGFEAGTGSSCAAIAVPLAQAQARGLLATTAEGRWVPTALGRRFLNDLQALFLPEGAGREVGAGLAIGGRIG